MKVKYFSISLILVAITISVIVFFAGHSRKDTEDKSKKTDVALTAGPSSVEPMQSASLSKQNDKPSLPNKPTSRRTESIVSIVAENSPLGTRLGAMEEKANGGDNAAALQLYVELKDCRDLVRRGEEFVRNSKMSKDDELESKKLLDSLNRCKGIGVEDTTDILRWLDMAARRGDMQAQIMWIDSFLDEKGGARWMLQHPEEVEEYKNQSMDYLKTLSSQCSPDAITILFWEYYKNGALTKIDSYQAYKYAYLLNILNPGGVATDQINDLASGLSQKAINDAIHSANIIYESSCK